MNFDSLGLRAELLRAVREQGFDAPTTIQQRAIPSVLAGRDVMASARTGTGKTAAFVLPLLQRLADRPAAASGRPHVLILTPTRELAAQVYENITALGRHLRLRSAVVFGGVNINPQISRLRGGVDLLVATPGRLIDLMQRRSVALDAVQALVLDEADRMLDMGFRPSIERIVRTAPAKRQTLLFSATFSGEVLTLAKRYSNDPLRVEAAPANSTVDAIDQTAIHVDGPRKRALLAWMIGHNNWRQVLIFTRTKHGANRLARQLEQDGIASDAIHGNKSQGARTRALKNFKNGGVRALVATDIAARGLDIDQLPQVVNFDMPQVAEDYVHRIGRTGRAGRSGLAVSLVGGEDRACLDRIKRLTGRDIPLEIVAGFEPSAKAAAPKSRKRPNRSRKSSSAGARSSRSSRRGPSRKAA